jgi:hypothetical protein
MVTTIVEPTTNREITTPRLDFGSDFEARAVSPYREMGAYEVLWSDARATFKSLATRFGQHPDSVPSDFVAPEDAIECAAFVKQRLTAASIARFGVCVHGTGEYPAKLRDAAHPVELLYYQGWWDLVASRSVAVVGTRKPSRDGLARTRRLVRELVSDIQARAALQQGRKLFVLDSCFRNPSLKWPERLASKGAKRVGEYDDIRRDLSESLQ